MPQASLNALLDAYQAQIDWLLRQADEFDKAERRVMADMGGKEIDLSPNIAAEYKHKAGNMQAILQAYERLHAKETRLKLALALPSPSGLKAQISRDTKSIR